MQKFFFVIHYYILTQFSVIRSSTSCLFCSDICKNNALAICNTILLTRKTRIEIIQRSCLLLLFCSEIKVNLEIIESRSNMTQFNIIIQHYKNIFTRMEYKHNSMRLSCKCRPAVVEFRVTTGIPELNINFGHPVFHLYILKTHLVEIEYYPSKISSNN